MLAQLLVLSPMRVDDEPRALAVLDRVRTEVVVDEAIVDVGSDRTDVGVNTTMDVLLLNIRCRHRIRKQIRDEDCYRRRGSV